MKESKSLILDYFDKISKCISSCKTYSQTLVCMNMILNFDKKFNNTIYTKLLTNEFKNKSNLLINKRCL